MNRDELLKRLEALAARLDDPTPLSEGEKEAFQAFYDGVNPLYRKLEFLQRALDLEERRN